MSCDSTSRGGDVGGAEASDVLDHLGQLTLTIEQGVDLAADTVGGRYSCRHGRSPSFSELVALEGTYVRCHLHQGWDATVEGKPVRLRPSGMPTEERLEELIEQDPGILGQPLMIIGRQVRTDFGGRIDLLAIDGDGNLHVLELKKDKTPRDVVAQALDYGLWVKDLSNDDVRRLFSEYGKHSGSFDEVYESAFGFAPPEDINSAHRLTVIAAEVDAATERIVEYLAEYAVPVNVLFFRYFDDGDRQYLARSLLLDLEQAAVTPASSKEPWNGTDWYVSFGEFPEGRSWVDAVRYGFVSAGGGEWFSRTLRNLPVGARVFACIPKAGYVGVGRVTAPAAPYGDAILTVDDIQQRFAELPLTGTYTHDNGEAEWIVAVQWIATRPREKAFWRPGMFANQNSAARLRSKYTLDQLYDDFGIDTQGESGA
jgi:hypothetical protein